MCLPRGFPSLGSDLLATSWLPFSEVAAAIKCAFRVIHYFQFSQGGSLFDICIGVEVRDKGGELLASSEPEEKPLAIFLLNSFSG